MDLHPDRATYSSPQNCKIPTRSSSPRKGTHSSDTRIPVAVIHPGSIERLGIHYSWSTSTFVDVRVVAADYDEARDALLEKGARVAILGLMPLASSSATVNISILRDTLRRHTDIRWIILAPQPCPECQTAARQEGAYGYFDTPLSIEQLESAVAWVDIGRQVGWHDAPVTSSAGLRNTHSTAAEDSFGEDQLWKVDASHVRPRVHRNTESPFQESSSRLKKLSEREREVLEGLASGRTNQQIADALYLSVKTIETYRSRLKQKLGLKDRAEIVAFFHSRV
ncbi:MAG: LuxR C-terminal-related transcriptional regulator [Rhodopirellula sp. JB044]|uniref:LuxR C-terminal-related transcriptional regulator n=1 Tax=Rhodopirellula sp. JB044 TaxID=3342844 RepID=UPI00370BEF11